MFCWCWSLLQTHCTIFILFCNALYKYLEKKTLMIKKKCIWSKSYDLTFNSQSMTTTIIMCRKISHHSERDERKRHWRDISNSCIGHKNYINTFTLAIRVIIYYMSQWINAFNLKFFLLNRYYVYVKLINSIYNVNVTKCTCMLNKLWILYTKLYCKKKRKLDHKWRIIIIVFRKNLFLASKYQSLKLFENWWIELIITFSRWFIWRTKHDITINK